MNLTFTDADITDLPLIVEIYNSTIASGMVTADTEPVSASSKIEWFTNHNVKENRPLWLVKNDEDIIGWVSFQSFYGRPAYIHTAELSIYLHEDYRDKGFGKTILNHCLQSGKQLDIKTLLGFIFQHNLPSLKLFTNAGFSQWGLLPDVAFMNNTNRSLVIVGKRID